MPEGNANNPYGSLVPQAKKGVKIIVADDYFLTGKRREANRIIQRQIYRLYLDKLEELHENRLLEHIDLKILAFTIFGAINSFFKWYREGGPLSKEDVAQNVITIVFNGILKDKK